ncbi:MAG: LysM peptidoglycan-binding domain-containing protein [Planctomycetota bacterium]
MANRSKPDRRPERGGDSLEAIKPLIVLALFGTILYGAYSVVQKGPSKDQGSHAAATEAPPFAPPAVELPGTPAAPVAATPAAAPPAAPPALAPPAAPQTATVAQQPLAAPPSVQQPLVAPPIAAAPGAPPALTVPTLPTDPPAAPVAALTAPDSAALAATAAGLTAAAAATAADAVASRGVAPVVDAASLPPTAPPAPASAGQPTYLAAESAPPPVQDDALAAVASGGGEDRPDRFALATRGQVPTSLPPEMPPPPGTLPSSAAFTTAWADAHDKLAAGRYAEALTALSVWYDDPALGLEESHRLEDLLGQLAGTVIYSQQDLLMPPHVVAQGETLPAIAAPLGVSWQLLAKINGVSDPMQLIPGEHLKVMRGPFDAVVSVARRRLSLQLGGAYAGSFPVVVGREFLPRVGSSLPVTETRRDAAAVGPAAGPAILLADGLVIQAADDPAVVADDAAPSSLIVSARDFAELVDILGPGSSVLVRQ